VSWLGVLARLGLGGVWLEAGALKLIDPAASVRAVRAYELLPEPLVRPVGYLLPSAEVVVGLLLIVGLFTRAATTASCVLFALFVAAIISVWVRGLSIECGCFGGGGTNQEAAADYPWEIARDSGLFLVSAWLAWVPRTAWALDNLLRTSPTTLEGAPGGQQSTLIER